MKPYIMPFVLKPELASLFAKPARRRQGPPPKRTFPRFRGTAGDLCPYHSMPQSECGCVTY